MPREPLRLAGAVLTLSLLVPVDTAHDGPRSVWQLVPDLRPASVWVLLAAPVAGVLMLAASFACKRAISLALVTLASIAGLFVVTAAGAEVLAWDLLRQPDTWQSGPAPGLLAVALAATGAGHALPVRARRALVVVAVPFAAAHLMLPWPGEARIRTVARVVAHVATSSGPGNLVSAVVLATVVLWPGLAPAVGWIQTRRTAPRSPRATLAAYGLPAALLPLVERSLTNPWGGTPGAAMAVGSVAVLGAVLLALVSAIGCLASLSSLSSRADRWTALACLAAAALPGLGTTALVRPPEPSTSFALGPPTPAGDHLFGTLLPRWNDARARVDLQGSGAGDLTAAEEALLSAARETGGELGHAIRGLVFAAGGPDRMERRWYREVERLDDALRRNGLPYYVDPTEIVGTEGDASARWYRLDAYRIDAVRRFTAGGRDLATLHVRSLAPARAIHGSLGLSRDVQPFAVVVLDEIDAYRQELEQLAAGTPPRCGSAAPDTGPLRACGELLAILAREGGLGAALVGLTERHELQHRLDAPLLPRSAWLERRLSLRPPGARDRIARELSAYLAQTTAPGPAPRLSLVRLLRMALVVRRGVEHETAQLALEALGLSESRPLEPAAVQDEVLRARGERAWAELFGGRLPHVSAR